MGPPAGVLQSVRVGVWGRVDIRRGWRYPAEAEGFGDPERGGGGAGRGGRSGGVENEGPTPPDTSLW